MATDLFPQENAEALAGLRPTTTPEPGTFSKFWEGTGMSTMAGLARVGRAVDLLGAVGPIAEDAWKGGTEAQDKYFQEHDEVWGSAVDYWMPKPGEVGVAGQITGTLLSTLPLVMASPGLVIGSTILGTDEDLVKAGVPAGKAQAAGLAMGAGLGLGIWVPIFGTSLWQRMLLGGAGFNVLQGMAMRGASGLVLHGTSAEGQFRALDPGELTLDLLMGLGFGAIAHLVPSQAREGAKFWEDAKAWGKDNIKPSDMEALAVMRQAQHAQADSLNGVPHGPRDVEAHVARLRQALEQLQRGQPVDVEHMPEPRVEPVMERFDEMTARAVQLADMAEGLRIEEGLPHPDTIRAEPGQAGELRFTESLGIERADMPQIRTSDMPEFLDFAKQRGVAVSQASVPVSELKPAQVHYNPAQVEQMTPEALAKPLTVSSDGYVLDGTNRFVRLLRDNPDASVAVTRIDMPAREALALMHGFPKAFTKGLEQVGRTRGIEPMVAQSEWLAEQASHAGFASLDDMVAREPQAFEQLAEQWRRAHEVVANVALQEKPAAVAAEKLTEQVGEAKTPKTVKQWKARLPERDKALLREVPQLESVYKEALEVDPMFSEVMRGIASETGAQPVIAPLKGVARAVEKIKAEYGGDAKRIKDLVRGTLLAETPEQALEVVRKVQEKTQIVGTPRNGLDPSAPATADGYRDAKFNVEINGHTVEIQVNVPEMFEAKKVLHPLYEERDAITRKAALEGRDLTPAEARRRDLLNAQMRSFYDATWAAVLAKKAAAESSVPLRSTEAMGNQRGVEPSQARAAPEGSTETGTPSTSQKRVPAGKAGLSTEGSLASDPLRMEAERVVAENPDAAIVVGTDEAGNPVTRKMGDYVKSAQEQAARAREEAGLFATAAECLLGVL